MISKAKLRERLLDIAAGAGLVWDEDQYWQDPNLERYGMFMQGIAGQFNLEYERLSLPWHLEKWEDFDELVPFIHEEIAIAEMNG